MLNYGHIVMLLCSRVKEHRGNTMSPVIHGVKRVMGLCVFTGYINELYRGLCFGVYIMEQDGECLVNKIMNLYLIDIPSTNIE